MTIYLLLLGASYSNTGTDIYCCSLFNVNNFCSSRINYDKSVEN